jgi:hypothetical protein
MLVHKAHFVRMCIVVQKSEILQKCKFEEEGTLTNLTNGFTRQRFLLPFLSLSFSIICKVKNRQSFHSSIFGDQKIVKHPFSQYKHFILVLGQFI